jgi:hypothetical protein
MYDTLMQMGRWFGYRPGYMDACRLFITAELQDWYQYIACAMLELRKDFDYVSLIGATPQDFGMRVRQHPAELEITSANKMRSGTQMQVSFADTLVESVFFLKKGPNPQNLQAPKDLFGRLGKPTAPEKKKHYYAWYDVTDHWISKDDEWLDLEKDELGTALSYTKSLWQKSTKKDKGETEPDEPTGKGARNARPSGRGLLLIGAIAPSLDGRKPGDTVYTAFAISFPASDSGQAVTYTVNNVYSDTYGGINEADA